MVLLTTCDEGLNIKGEPLESGESAVFDCVTEDEITDILLHHETLVFLTTVFFELNHNNGELEVNIINLIINI